MIVGLIGGSVVKDYGIFTFQKEWGLNFKVLNREFSLSECIGKQYLVNLIGLILICSFPMIDSAFAARLTSVA